MKIYTTILEKVANEQSYLHSICGGDFLSAIYDLCNSTDNGQMDNECAKSFLQLFAEKNDIKWEVAVEYLFYIIKEAQPSLYKCEDRLDWVNICLHSKIDSLKEFMKNKNNTKYASKQLFETFCKRADLDTMDCLKEEILNAYSWNMVIKILGMFVIEEYLSVEERYETVGNNISAGELESQQVEIIVEKNNSAEENIPSISSKAEEEQNEESSKEIASTPKEENHVNNSTSADITMPTEEQEKYKSGALKVTCLDNGESRIFNSRKEVERELGIKVCSISNYFRTNKEFCRPKGQKLKYVFEELAPKKDYNKQYKEVA